MVTLEPEIIATIRVHGKGRITIVSEIREAYGIKDGDKVHWVKIGAEYYLRPVKMPRAPIRTEHGITRKTS